MNYTFRQIADMLGDRAEEVSKYLFSKGKRTGSEFCVGDIYGNEGDSLKIHLNGNKAGIWKDFADGNSKGGDLLSLWALNRRITLKEAFLEAKQYLGIPQPSFIPQRSLNWTRPKPAGLVIPNGLSNVINYLTKERKLTTETLQKFSIREKDKNIVFPYYRDDQLIQVKYLGLERENGKKKIWAEKNCEPCLFGWQTIPNDSTTLTICEGEIDAMSLYQFGFPALSVPFGAGTGQKNDWIETEWENLAPYNEIYLCFDKDETGKKAVFEIAERLGRHRCRIVDLPCKDANECLQKEVTCEEISVCFQNARTLDPEELKWANTFVDKVISVFFPPEGTKLGINPPWKKAQDKIIFRPSELSIWSGINGHGKSQLLGQIILSSMEQGSKVCIASLELKPERLLFRLTRQAGGMANLSMEYIKQIHEWYNQKLLIFDLLGTAKSARLLELFLYARQRYGVDTFVIDSLLKLDIAEDDYKSQKAFIEKICDFKNEFNCHVHIVVHPRKGADESQAPGKMDYKGSGAISDLADNCFSIWRNKAKEEAKRLTAQGFTLNAKQKDELKTFDCLLACDKQRNGDWEGKIGLWFDPGSFQYLNSEGQKPSPYVNFSRPNA
jgi:twinkle protein